MAKRRIPGLIKRGETWHIDKQIKGYGRLRESCGTSDYSEAQRYLAFRLEGIRQTSVYGVRPTRTFEQATAKYLEEHQHKRTIDRDVYALKAVMPYIGHLSLELIHNDSLSRFKRDRLEAGRSAGTINKELGIVTRILNLASRVWRHPNGQTWLSAPPLLEKVKGPKRKPYPISWEDQGRLFRELPPHLATMALFAVNTGCRAGEILALRWDWEVYVPELKTTVFVLPDTQTKNGEERVVVLNHIARSIIERERGKHSVFVFSYKGRPLKRLRTHAWERARERAGLPGVRVHDLRHTFGHRARAAGVSTEDREDLMGHKSERMTTHYSAPDLGRLIEAANKVCTRRPSTILRVATEPVPKKSHKIPTIRVPQKDRGRKGIR